MNIVTVLKKFKWRDFKRKDEVALIGVALCLFVLVAAVVVYGLTFLATSLNRATNDTSGLGGQTIRFNLDAAKNLGLE